MGQTIVLLLAGGEGARLYPLTKDRSKPSVPFGGMWRLADFTLSNCLHSGLSRIYLLTQYKSESLTRHLYQTWQFFRPVLGESINVLPPQLRETRDFYRGTADAVYQNMYTIQREGARDVVIVSGDHVYAMDYRPFLAYHHETDADLTIGAFPVPRSEAHRFGILRAREDGRVTTFVEKPKDLSHALPDEDGKVNASMGVYVFKAQVLLRELQEGPGMGRKFDFGGDIIPGMINRERVFLYPFKKGALGHKAYWRDVGTLDSYFEANMDLLGPSPEFDIHNRQWPIIHSPDQTGPSVLRGGSAGSVRNAIVAGGCRIDGEVSDSVIFSNVTIEAGARVSQAILLSGAYVEANTIVRNAILDKGVRIRRGTIIGAGSTLASAKHGKKVVYTPAGVAVVAKGEVVGAERIERAAVRSLGDEVLMDHEAGGPLPARPEAGVPELVTGQGREAVTLYRDGERA